MSRTSPTCCRADRSAVQVCQGEDWRLVIDPARHPFGVLIGGRDWAAELSTEELLVLGRAIGCLRTQHTALVDQLMAEESLELDLELPLGLAGSLWMALEGDRQDWALRFVLTPAAGVRAFEGAWSAAASAAVSAALEELMGTGDSVPAATV